MTRLFDRRATLTLNDHQFDSDLHVNGKHVPGFRIAFKIAHSLDNEGNKAEIKIENLSESSRAAVQERRRAEKQVLIGTPAGPRLLVVPGRLSPCVLAAGYGESTGTIFKGECTHVFHERTSTGFVTTASAADGLAAKRGIVNASLAPGATFGSAIKAAIDSLGAEAKKVLGQVAAGDFDGAKKTFLNGITLAGPASKVMDTLAKTAGFSWSVQNGELVILLDDATIPGKAVLLSPTSGLLGSPRRLFDKKFVNKTIVAARSLLQARLVIGRQVVLDSSELKGTFKIVRTEHVGDTAGNDWYTDLEMVRATSVVSDGVPPDEPPSTPSKTSRRPPQ